MDMPHKILSATPVLRFAHQPLASIRWLSWLFSAGVLVVLALPVVAQNWQTAACSADGSKLVAIASSNILTSTNSGATWRTNAAPVANWGRVASSADGTKLVATIFGGNIYTSQNSGASWTSNNVPPANWNCVVSSADGRQLTAGGPSNSLYTSTNAGANWTSNHYPSLTWRNFASSADGQKLVAEVFTQNEFVRSIYTSTNGGGTWTSNNLPSFPFGGIASSADGSKLVAALYGKGVYVSTNSGATWTQTIASVFGFSLAASSADGSQLEAGGFSTIYRSTNSGTSWNFLPVNGDWASIASSADGSKLILVDVFFDRVVISQFTPTPVLNLAASGTNFILSWIVPSTNFVVQQKSSLMTTNWTNSGTPPTLTNLEYQVTVPLMTNSMFFRLVSVP